VEKEGWEKVSEKEHCYISSNDEGKVICSLNIIIIIDKFDLYVEKEDWEKVSEKEDSSISSNDEGKGICSLNTIRIIDKFDLVSGEGRLREGVWKGTLLY